MDTIAARATAPVRSAVAIVRLSGPRAKPIARAVFPAADRLRPRRMRFGAFCVDGERVDEGLAVYMPGPGSYTGEDCVELYCHGSPGVTELLLDALYRAGARPARPGEYTRRAFENGRLDLAQAEAVIDLIDSETRAEAKNAAAQLAGALGKKIAPLRDALVGLAAHFSAVIDYPDDDVPPFFTRDALEILHRTHEGITAVLAGARDGQILRGGAVCVLAGEPNAGKSSLLNALAGEERAIVTPIPGTTRDIVETRVVWEGIAVRILDTAGLRESRDPIEREGIARTHRAMEGANLILAVLDGTREKLPEPGNPEEKLPEPGSRDIPVIAVVNKCDLGRRLPPTGYEHEYGVSALTGEGIEALREGMKAVLKLGSVECGGGAVTNPRQMSALTRARDSVERAWRALELGVTPDAVMTDVEEAAAELGEITGESASEDIMNAIFSRFCVGK